MSITLDNINEYQVSTFLVTSLPQFLEYLDKIAPKPIRRKDSKDVSFMGIQIKEHPYVPSDTIVFCDRYGSIIGNFYLEPEHGEIT